MKDIMHVNPENRKIILNYEIKRLFYNDYKEKNRLIKAILKKINEKDFEFNSFIFFIIEKLVQFK